LISSLLRSINVLARAKNSKKSKSEGVSGLMLALGGSHPSSSTNIQDAQSFENDEDEDLLDDSADKAISIVNSPVLILLIIQLMF
jgi:hypothetical protein